MIIPGIDEKVLGASYRPLTAGDLSPTLLREMWLLKGLMPNSAFICWWRSSSDMRFSSSRRLVVPGEGGTAGLVVPYPVEDCEYPVEDCEYPIEE